MNKHPYILFTKAKLKGGFRNIFLILLSLTSLQSFSASQASWSEQSFNLGRLHTCAQGVNDIFCWGYDSDPSGNSTDVPTLENVQQLALGSYFGCAIDGASLNCWGNNDYGQTSNPTLNNVVEVAAGSSHACALSQVNPSQNQLTCWGDNSDGKTTTPSDLNNPTQLSAAYNHSCVIDGATVKCWGSDSYGETTNKTLNNPTQVIVGAYANCAFDDDGVTCWGRESDTAQFTGNVLKVGLGFNHGCALIDEGSNNSLQCWGDNTNGQQNIPSLTNPTDLAVGRSNVCVIDNGNVICWGYKSRWESSETDISWQNAQQLTVGEDHFCASNQGTLVCFGDDHYGQVSIPNSDSDSANDVVDAFPENPNETHDTDGDGTGDNSDAFPSDRTETHDSDGDGVGNNKDRFPNDITEWIDTDGDGYGDNKADLFPNDKNEWFDDDKDGRGDNLADKFPSDPFEWSDLDNDSCGDNKDQFDNDPTECLDTDRDGVGDNTDAFPTNENEQKDSDGDGVGDNADPKPFDFDNDGVNDTEDVFPNDRSEWADNDQDNCGDNRDQFDNDPNECLDSDKDGYGDNSDVFPYDPTEWLDTDKDGCGNNDDTADNDPSICFKATDCDIRGLLNTHWLGNSPFYERRKTINGQRYIKKYYIPANENVGTTHIPHGTGKELLVNTWDGSRIDSYGYEFACENAELYWVYRQDSRYKTPFCYDTKDGKTTLCEVEKTEGSTRPIESWWLPSL